jgi:hypothetical protein
MKHDKSTEHRPGHFKSGGPLVLTQSAQSRVAISQRLRGTHSIKRMKAVQLDWRKAG